MTNSSLFFVCLTSGFWLNHQINLDFNLFFWCRAINFAKVRLLTWLFAQNRDALERSMPVNGKWQWYLGFAALILGLLFSRVLPGGAQAQADTRLKNQTLVETITQLEKEISGMEKELSALREETEQLQNNQAGGKSVSSSMQSDIELQQSLAGLTELRGPVSRLPWMIIPPGQRLQR